MYLTRYKCKKISMCSIKISLYEELKVVGPIEQG